MAFEPFVIWLFIGLVAGWSASILAQDNGYGLFGRMGVGVFGALSGALLVKTFGLSEGGGPLGEILGAVLGAIGMLFISRFIRFIRAPRDQV